MVVVSLSITTRLADPSCSILTFSSLMPNSSAISWPPVRMAMSCNISLRRSPNPGAFTAAQARVPRKRFTTSVARASASTSSEMISKGRAARTTCSSGGSRSLTLAIFFSYSRIKGSSKAASMRSGSVTK